MPTGASTVDRIIDLFPSEDRGDVMAALADLETNTLANFVTLLIGEAQKQARQRRQGTDNLVDDNQCLR